MTICSFALSTGQPVVTISSNCSCLSNGKVSVPMETNFTLSCVDTNSKPRPVFTWFRDGVVDPDDLLVPDSHVAIETASQRESRLVFTNIDFSYAGEYHCKANNSEQKDMKSVTVNVQSVQ